MIPTNLPARRAEFLALADYHQRDAARVAGSNPVGSADRFREAESYRRRAEIIAERMASDLESQARRLEDEAARLAADDVERAAALTGEAAALREQAAVLVADRQPVA